MADADAILERALAQLKNIHDSGDEGGAAVLAVEATDSEPESAGE